MTIVDAIIILLTGMIALIASFFQRKGAMQKPILYLLRAGSLLLVLYASYSLIEML